MKLYIASALTAFALSCAFCPLLIAVLRKMGAGQNILVYVKEHSKKSGTPTMGGIAFIAAAIFSAALFIPQAKTQIILTIVIGLFYMIIGIMDDLLKKKHKKNLGLKAWQKLFFQVFSQQAVSLWEIIWEHLRTGLICKKITTVFFLLLTFTQ